MHDEGGVDDPDRDAAAADDVHEAVAEGAQEDGDVLTIARLLGTGAPHADDVGISVCLFGPEGDSLERLIRPIRAPVDLFVEHQGEPHLLTRTFAVIGDVTRLTVPQVDPDLTHGTLLVGTLGQSPVKVDPYASVTPIQVQSDRLAGLIDASSHLGSTDIGHLDLPWAASTGADPVQALNQPETVAGIPGVSSLRVDPSTLRFDAHHLEVPGGLPTGCGTATLTRYCIEWRSLGWVLDEWLDTVAAAPGESLARSTTDADQRQTAGASGTSENREGVRTRRSDVSTATEVMTSAAKAVATGIGVSAGLGTIGSVALGGPAAALTVGGSRTLDLGVTAGRTSQRAEGRADVARALSQKVEDEAARRRDIASRSDSTMASGLTDLRSLSAIQNPTATMLNLARFSVGHLWFVRYAVEEVLGVVLVPILDVGQSFTGKELFVHRAVLADALLDPELGDDLDRFAAAYDPDPASAPPVEAVQIGFDVEDGREDVTVCLRSDQEQLHRSTTELVPGRISLEVDLGRPLEQLRGIDLDLSGAGWRDTVQLRNVTVSHRWAGEDTWHPLVEFGPQTLKRKQAVHLHLPAPVDARVGHDLAALERRLLAHVDAHRVHYRLALDLARSPAERHVSLTRVEAEAVDLEPIGVVGCTLAYAKRSTDETRGTGKHLFDRLLTTPTDATFTDIAVGRTAVPPGPGPHPAPPWQLPTEQDGGFTWPTPATFTASTPALLADGTVVAAPAAGTPHAPTDLGAAILALDSRFAAVEKALDALTSTSASGRQGGEADDGGGSAAGAGADEAGAAPSDGAAPAGGAAGEAATPAGG